MTERDAEPSADAVKLVDEFDCKTGQFWLSSEAGLDHALFERKAARAALLDHIAGLRAEIERYQTAYEVEKKYSALRCDEAARLSEALAAKDAEIERLQRARIGDSELMGGYLCRAEKAEAELARLKAARKIDAAPTQALLREVADKGLIYWEPQTARGYAAKQNMLARINAALKTTGEA